MADGTTRLLSEADLARNLARLERHYTPEPNTGCWLWTGFVDRAGYGQSTLGGKFAHAHRAMWLASGRAIPPGLELDHRCRQRSCVNPAHLEPVTHAENRRRAWQSHCKRGHALDDAANVYVHRDGARRCRICVDARRTA